MAPVVEYLKYADKFECKVLQLLLQYGSEVNIRQPRERIKILDKYGAVEHMQRLESNSDFFEMLVNVVGVFNIKDIEKEYSLPETMKTVLIREGSTPRRLKHQIRIQIRRLLKVPIPDQIEQLPLPRIIKDYLLYQMWDRLYKFPIMQYVVFQIICDNTLFNVIRLIHNVLFKFHGFPSTSDVFHN